MAFDSLAAGYDVDFSARPIPRWLREREYERLSNHVKPGKTALDLGCGTGTDALWLAGQSMQVTALDASTAMLDLTRRKLAAFHDAEIAQFNLNALPTGQYHGPFHLVLSNFGALNNLEDMRPLVEWLIPRVVSGGVVCVAVMTRFCLWETAWNLLHLKPGRAFRRWGRQGTFRGVNVYYHGMFDVIRAFAPEFRLTHKRGLGVFLPPSEMFDVVEKRPRLLKTLTALDARLWKYGTGTRIADHAWLEFTRR